ncbi:MAG: hypothetical protein JXA66_09030 [Oligoflexia bacterium]|nr:hypothetical protein [Oligoflexia bacterium]
MENISREKAIEKLLADEKLLKSLKEIDFSEDFFAEDYNSEEKIFYRKLKNRAGRGRPRKRPAV